MENEWTEKIELLESCIKAATYNINAKQAIMDKLITENDAKDKEIAGLKATIQVWHDLYENLRILQGEVIL